MIVKYQKLHILVHYIMEELFYYYLMLFQQHIYYIRNILLELNFL